MATPWPNEKTRNINLNTKNTTDNLRSNGCYYTARFCPTLDVRSVLQKIYILIFSKMWKLRTFLIVTDHVIFYFQPFSQ